MSITKNKPFYPITFLLKAEERKKLKDYSAATQITVSDIIRSRLADILNFENSFSQNTDN